MLKGLLNKIRDKRVEKKDLVIAILVFAIIAILFFAWYYFVNRRNPVDLSLGSSGNPYTYSYALYDPLKMQRPLGVAVNDRGQVLVADSVNHRIAVFDAQGNFVKALGGPGSGPGQFNYPSGIACYGNKIYVSDFYNQRVQVINSDGKQLSVIPGARDRKQVGATVMPVTVATDLQGNLYVSDLSVQRILVFSSRGEFVRSFGKGGSNPGEFSYVNGIAVNDKDGLIYLANSNNSRVDVFTLEGKFVKTLSGSLTNPKGLAYDKQTDRVYTADTFAHRVTGIDASGNVFENIGYRGSEAGAFNFPTAVAIGSDGKLYVADRENNRIGVYRR